MASDITNVEDRVSRSAEDSSLSGIVQLEIYRPWWWWSGFPRYNGWYRTILADIGEPRFYDEAAFPSLKPDIDLFGVPHRSRKQRGWYQIVAPVPGQPTPPTETHHAWATASDIPPELFKSILSGLSRDKHTLARCGQVCRYWDRVCRQMLFETVNLRSREEASHLLHLMRDPTSDVSYLVKEVQAPLAQNMPSAPWFHLLPLIKDCSGRYRVWLSVRLSGPLPPGQRSLRSIHYALPRALPHFSRHITWLHLTDLHFAKLDDLMHLMWEMPHLRYLYCSKVTWGSFPLTPPRRKLLGYPLRTELDEGCGPRSVEAAVWLSNSVVMSLFFNVSVLSIDDSARVLAIARAIDKTATRALAPLVNHHQHCFEMRIEREVYIQFHDDSQFKPPQSVPRLIRKLTMLFQSLSNANMVTQPAFIWRNFDWAIVGTALSSFPVLRRVIVGLDTREDMVDFDNIARAHMSRLHGTGVFQYALWDLNEVNWRNGTGSWLRASFDSDETEPSGRYRHELDEVYK